MQLKQRFSNATSRQWIWFAVWVVLTILFAFWAGSPWIMLFIFLFLDIYITKFVPWDFGELKERSFPQDHGMGRCDCLCIDCCLLYQHLLLSELSDTDIIA